MRWLQVLAFLLFLGLPTLGNAECAGVEDQFPLLCRGPLSLVATWEEAHVARVLEEGYITVVVDGLVLKNPTQAGSLGEQLLPGSCAWEDRPLRDEEPPRFRMKQKVGRYFPWSLGYETVNGILTDCAAKPSCVVLICAKRDPSWATDALLMNPTFINTLYPNFVHNP